jgi:hypothetical protein
LIKYGAHVSPIAFALLKTCTVPLESEEKVKRDAPRNRATVDTVKKIFFIGKV